MTLLWEYGSVGMWGGHTATNHVLHRNLAAVCLGIFLGFFQPQPKVPFLHVVLCGIPGVMLWDGRDFG